MSHNDEGFFIKRKSSKARLREAENARKNRAEILKGHFRRAKSPVVNWSNGA